MKEVVSVIIPVYNGECFLEETIRSIQSSTYQTLEIILVDDGSTDSSPSICKRLMVSDSRIKYYRKVNGGIADARNYGLSKATGKYLCFVDQDDLVQPNMYTELVDRIRSDSSDFALGGTGKYTGSDFSVYESYEDKVYDRQEIFETLFTPMMFGYLVPPSYPNVDRKYCSIWKCLFRTEFIRKNNIKFIKLIDFEDDHTFLSEAYLYASRISTISMVCYLWRVNLNSESYTFKYLPDLSKKQINYYKYFLNILNRYNISYRYISEWTENLDTQFVISSIENACSKNNPSTYIAKVKLIRDVSESWKNKYNASTTIRFRKGVLKKRAIYLLMKNSQYWLLPGIVGLLNFVGTRYQKSSRLTKIERSLKK